MDKKEYISPNMDVILLKTNCHLLETSLIINGLNDDDLPPVIDDDIPINPWIDAW